MSSQLVHEIASACDQARLWPAQQFIAGEEHEVCSGFQTGLRRRLRGQPELRRVEQAAASDVVEQGDVMLARECC